MKKNKKIHSLRAFLLSVMIVLTVLSPLSIKAEENKTYFVDDAGLVSAIQAEDLENRLEELAQKDEMDFVIVTEEDPYVTSAMEYADDYFDYNGYGVGTDRSGALLYINMETCDWYIATRGYAITVFTDAGLDYIGEQITGDLGDGDYFAAFKQYVRLCDEFCIQAESGEPYDVGSLPKGPYPVGKFLLISVGAGLLVALIYILVLRGQLKSVAPNESAADYVVPGSLHVTNSRELFLYHTIHRTRRAENNSSGGHGGSHTHISSSGATHGGRGGKF